MPHAQEPIDKAHNAMVDDLVLRRIIRTRVLEQVFRRVRRHTFMAAPYAVATDLLAGEFVETTDPCRVYTDAAVALKTEKNLCLPPSIVAQQLEALAPAEGMRILQIETGAGYSTALLAELVGDRGSVVGIDYDEDGAETSAAFLARAGYTNVTVRSGESAVGVPEAAPFDRILISAGTADIAPAWVEQLGDDGRLVLPLCHVSLLGPRISSGMILTVERANDRLIGSISSVAVVVPLQGAMASTPEEDVALAEGLQRWSALEEFYRTDLPIRIVMKSGATDFPHSTSVPWFLETRNAIMWAEPN